MNKLLPLALLALTAVVAPALAQGAPGPMPAPKIVVLDRAAILQLSRAGQDVAKQLQQMANQNRANFEAQQKTLANEGQALRQQVAILAPDARAKREEAFNTRVRSIQESAERRQAQIQQAAGTSQQALAQALAPIINEIVKERGANMVVDKSAVIFASTNAFDITPEAIKRLDARMPTFKVTLGGAAAKP
jgi:outer membrane protein